MFADIGFSNALSQSGNLINFSMPFGQIPAQMILFIYMLCTISKCVLNTQYNLHLAV